MPQKLPGKPPGKRALESSPRENRSHAPSISGPRDNHSTMWLRPGGCARPRGGALYVRI